MPPRNFECASYEPNVLSRNSQKVSVEPLKIERDVYVFSSLSSVWHALTDERQFESWFQVKLDAPFRVGEISYGYSTYPGCEELRWRAVTETLDFERLLSFTWWPAPIDEPFDARRYPGTRVDISLRETVDSIRVSFCESGFEQIIDPYERLKNMQVRSQGWRLSADHLRAFLESR